MSIERRRELQLFNLGELHLSQLIHTLVRSRIERLRSSGAEGEALTTGCEALLVYVQRCRLLVMLEE